jgi:hypothetical protein
LAIRSAIRRLRWLNQRTSVSRMGQGATHRPQRSDSAPATEVARRAGHSVAVLLKVYATASAAKPTPSTSASPMSSAGRMSLIAR